ncbi:MAG: hypothetical protein ACYCV4_05500 [Dermatophilaceae bacterium]
MSNAQPGNPQPQTTVEAPGGPFLRHTQPGRRQLYTSTGNAFGATITNPIPGASGYYSRMRTKFIASGGSGTSVVAAADAPYNVAQMVNFQDSFGTPLIVAPGYEALYLIPKLSSTFGVGATSDVSNLPSYSAVAAASGDFTFTSALAFEFLKAYGVISGANASLQPRLTVNLNTTSQVYATAPATTVPTIEMDLDADFYWLTEGEQIDPPGLGTTQQWIYQACNPTIASGASTRVSLPRLGGYLSVLILEMRDSTNARVDAFPTADNRLRLYVDGVPLIDTKTGDLYDDMYIQYNAYGPSGTPGRPTGVIAFNRKTSLNQQDNGLLDTGEEFLSTAPGTLVEVEGAPWGSITNSPATMYCVLGQIIPSGTLAQGLTQV